MAAALGIIGLFGTVYSTISSISYANMQARQQRAAYEAQARTAEYNARIAENNAKLAENQASSERRQGYDEAMSIRLKGAKAVSAQRAAMGASGAVVDYGSTLDTILDTTQLSEIDAINAYNKGIDNAYNYDIEASNYRTQAQSYLSQASSYYSAAGSVTPNYSSALGGIASIGSTWGSSTNWWNY